MAVRGRQNGRAATATTGHKDGLEYGFKCILHLLLQRHFFNQEGRNNKLRLLSEGVGVGKFVKRGTFFFLLT